VILPTEILLNAGCKAEKTRVD
jgi:hypothetical protein